MIELLSPFLAMVLFALALSLFAASILAVLTWFSPQVRWILPTLAGIFGTWHLLENVQPVDYRLWQLWVGGCLLVWIAHGYGATWKATLTKVWYGAVLKAATILWVCLVSELFINFHHK